MVRVMSIPAAIAVLLTATVLAACGSGAASASSTKPRFDARWSALQTCLNKEEHGTVETTIHPL